jgi:hypothetical protein
VRIASDVLRPVVIYVDIPTAKQVSLLLGKMEIWNLPSHLLPVLKGDVSDITPWLELILVRQRVGLVQGSVVVVIVLMVLEAVLVGSAVVGELYIVDIEKLCGLAMRMVEEQFDPAEVREMLVRADWLVTGEVVKDLGIAGACHLAHLSGFRDLKFQSCRNSKYETSSIQSGRRRYLSYAV